MNSIIRSICDPLEGRFLLASTDLQEDWCIERESDWLLAGRDNLWLLLGVSLNAFWRIEEEERAELASILCKILIALSCIALRTVEWVGANGFNTQSAMVSQ